MSNGQLLLRPWEGSRVLFVHRKTAFVELCDRMAWTEGLDRVGATGSRRDALELVQLHRPELVVAGIDLVEDRSDGGRRFLVAARQMSPGLRLIVVSEQGDQQVVERALFAGASAFVVADTDTRELAWAIQQVFRHTVYLAHGVATAMPSATIDLTPREFQVLSLVSQGQLNKTIARSLSVSDETVKFHLTNVYRKLGVSNRTEATSEAYRLGLRMAID